MDRSARPAPDISELDPRGGRALKTLERQLTELYENILNTRPVGIEDNFFDLGGDSLMAVSLLVKIEEQFGRIISLSTLFQAATVKQLAVLLSGKDILAARSSLVAIQPGGSNPPIFCVHALGGGVLGFRNLSRYLGTDQPFYGLHALSHDGGKIHYSGVEEMATQYVREIRSVQPEGPYFLGGSCFGGVVAFEMAQQLLAQGQTVALLAMFDTTGPTYPPLWQRFRFHWNRVKRLGFKKQCKYILVRVVINMERLKKRLLRTLVKMPLRARTGATLASESLEGNGYILLNQNYTPHVYPGRLTFFKTTEQDAPHPDHLNGWSGLAALGVDLHRIHCAHLNIFSEPHVEVVAGRLKVCLDEAREGFRSFRDRYDAG